MSKSVAAFAKVIVDAKLFSHAQVAMLKEKIPGLELNEGEILIDTCPEPEAPNTQPKYKFFEHGISCSGRSLDEKLALIRKEMADNQVQAI